MASLAITHPDFLEGWISFRSHFLQGEPCSNPGQNRPENMLASETGGVPVRIAYKSVVKDPDSLCHLTDSS